MQLLIAIVAYLIVAVVCLGTIVGLVVGQIGDEADYQD
jgi:hypothetical protein